MTFEHQFLSYSMDKLLLKWRNDVMQKKKFNMKSYRNKEMLLTEILVGRYIFAAKARENF